MSSGYIVLFVELTGRQVDRRRVVAYRNLCICSPPYTYIYKLVGKTENGTVRFG